MKKFILDFLKDEEGQTSTEYILLVAVVALIVFKFKTIATEKLTALTGNVFDKADQFVGEIE
jgi:pilus assembly protein Flp/PilA